MKYLLRLAAASAAIVLILLLFNVRSDGTVAGSPDTAITTLSPGWNLIGWVEQEAHIDQLFEQLPQVVEIHRDDGQSVSRHGELDIDVFVSLSPGRGYWFKVESPHPVFWQRPAQPASRIIKATAGDRLIAWTGRNGATIAEALAGIDNRLKAAWHWDAAKQRFVHWAPVPGIPHDNQEVRYGDAVLVRLLGPIDWLQPSGLLPEIVAPSGLLDSDRKIIEDDVRAVEAIFASRFMVPIDQTRVSFFIQGSEHWDPFIPCCAPDAGWPERSVDEQGDAQYRFAIPLTAWTNQSPLWTGPTASYGYRQLLKYYFRILQHEYAGNAIDAVPRWLVLGTTEQINEFAGRRPRYLPENELATNQLMLPATAIATLEDDALGRVYVSKLVAQSTRDAYFRFWSLMDQSGPPQDIWKRSFQLAFGIDADDFVRQTNSERRNAFTTVNGKLILEGGAPLSGLRISGWYADDYSRGPLRGTVSADGSYRIDLPRDHPYRLEIDAPVSGCTAHVSSSGQLSAHRDAELFAAEGLQDEGPDIVIPADFCRRGIHLRVVGPGVEELSDLELQRCTADGQTCSYWRTSIYDNAAHHRGRVPLPGKYAFKIQSSDQSCSAYLTQAGVTSDLAKALWIEATDPTVETVIELPADIQFCSYTLRGQFTGKPAGWYEGRSLRLYQVSSGASSMAILDGDGEFEAQLPVPGDYILSISVFQRTEHGLLSCSITSEQKHQWLRRISNPTQSDENYAAVSANDLSELSWQIAPYACQLVVSGQALSPDGVPLAWTELIACPDGGGLCENFQTDGKGRFQYLADSSWRYNVVTRSAWSARGVCQVTHKVASTISFSVRPDSPNHFTWTFPPSPCE